MIRISNWTDTARRNQQDIKDGVFKAFKAACLERKESYSQAVIMYEDGSIYVERQKVGHLPPAVKAGDAVILAEVECMFDPVSYKDYMEDGYTDYDYVAFMVEQYYNEDDYLEEFYDLIG